MAGERERLGKKAAAAIEAPGAQILISSIVIWEVAIKRRVGKLDAPALEQLERAGVDLLPITARHADTGSAPFPCATATPSIARSWPKPMSMA